MMEDKASRSQPCADEGTHSPRSPRTSFGLIKTLVETARDIHWVRRTGETR